MMERERRKKLAAKRAEAVARREKRLEQKRVEEDLARAQGIFVPLPTRRRGRHPGRAGDAAGAVGTGLGATAALVPGGDGALGGTASVENSSTGVGPDGSVSDVDEAALEQELEAEEKQLEDEMNRNDGNDELQRVLSDEDFDQSVTALIGKAIMDSLARLFSAHEVEIPYNADPEARGEDGVRWWDVRTWWWSGVVTL